MHSELAELTIAPAETDADLKAMIHVRGLVTPEAHPQVENLRFNLESTKGLTYVVGRAGDEPVVCGFVEPVADFARADIAVVPDRRHRGIGIAVLADLSERARRLGKNSLQGEVKESDTESRAFFERRGFVQVGAEKAVVLELADHEPLPVDAPEGVRIVSRAEEPDRLEEMYAVANQGEEDIPGSSEVSTFEGWRAHEIDKPNRRPEFTFLALAGDEVIGYAGLQVYEGDETFHGLTVTRRDWRRRGVASALKRAEIAAAKQAGFKRLLTESEERNEPMRKLNEKLGFVPAPDWSMIVIRGPLA
jgi:GNAT superfamily N-acetyltransferase